MKKIMLFIIMIFLIPNAYGITAKEAKDQAEIARNKEIQDFIAYVEQDVGIRAKSGDCHVTYTKSEYYKGSLELFADKLRKDGFKVHIRDNKLISELEFEVRWCEDRK